MFPRTQIEDLSVSRLMIGTNWFLGFSHTSKAQDRMIREAVDAKRVADILEVAMSVGVDTLYGMRPEPKLIEGVAEAEQRTGRKCILISIPSFPTAGDAASLGEIERIARRVRVTGREHLHAAPGDDRRVRQPADAFAGGHRADPSRHPGAGDAAGLSTHMPETPIYADNTGLDVATYIQIYNAAGFLMQIEVDWVQRMIWNAKKPVITIKPLGAGRLPPLVGMAFSGQRCDRLTWCVSA